jgi:hypothetical protein
MVGDGVGINTYCGYFVDKKFLFSLMSHCENKNLFSNDDDDDDDDDYDDDDDDEENSKIRRFCFEFNDFLDENGVNLVFKFDKRRDEYCILVGMPLVPKKYYDFPSTVFEDYGDIQNALTNGKIKFKKEFALFETKTGLCLPKKNLNLISMLECC